MADSRVSYVGASAGSLLVVLAVRTPHSRLLYVANSMLCGLQGKFRTKDAILQRSCYKQPLAISNHSQSATGWSDDLMDVLTSCAQPRMRTASIIHHHLLNHVHALDIRRPAAYRRRLLQSRLIRLPGGTACLSGP